MNELNSNKFGGRSIFLQQPFLKSPARIAKFLVWGVLVVASLFRTSFLFAQEAQRPPATFTNGISAQVQSFLQSGNLDGAIAFLEKRVSEGSESAEILALCSDLLASKAASIVGKRSPDAVSPASSAMVLGILRRARDLHPQELKRWVGVLEFLGDLPKERGTMVEESQKFFRQWNRSLTESQRPALGKLLKIWDSLFPEKTSPLERWWIVRVRAMANEPGKREQLELEARIRKRQNELIQRFQELLNRGEFVAADFLLFTFLQIEPEARGWQDLQTKLERSQSIQNLLAKAADFLKQNEFDECRRQCQGVLSLDPNNLSARETLKKLDEAQRTPGAGLYGSSAKPSDNSSGALIEELAKAEKEEDLAQVVRLIKELSFLGRSTPEQLVRLREVETEIENARMHLDERWREAQTLLEKQKWVELRRLLNRNPVFSIPERLLALEEMGLACAHFLKQRESDKIQAEAETLLKKHPQSFWASVVLMDLALARGDYKATRVHHDAARSQNTSSPILRFPRMVLWLQEHGWKIVPVLLLAVFYVLARSLPTVFGWLEWLYWPWIIFLCRFMPGVALGSLEGRIGRIREPDQKLKQYELLTQAAFKAGATEKGVRYAQLTLELDFENTLAIDALGRYFLGKAEGFGQHQDLLIRYMNRHLQEKPVLEKFIQQILQSGDLKPEMLPFVKRYLNFFPQDTKVINLASEVLRSWRATDVGKDGVDLLEKAFQAARDPALGQILWRVYVACGMHDQAIELSAILASSGTPVSMIGLLDLLEGDIEQKIMFLQQGIMGIEKPKQIEAMQAVLDLRHVSTLQANKLIRSLEGFEMDPDANIKFHSQKARDHLKRLGLECSTFRDRLRSMQLSSEKTDELAPDDQPDLSTSPEQATTDHEAATIVPDPTDPETPDFIKSVFQTEKDPAEAPILLAGEPSEPFQQLSDSSDHTFVEDVVAAEINHVESDTAFVPASTDSEDSHANELSPALSDQSMVPPTCSDEPGLSKVPEASAPEVFAPVNEVIDAPSEVELRMFRDLETLPFAEPSSSLLKLARSSASLFDDLPSRFYGDAVASIFDIPKDASGNLLQRREPEIMPVTSTKEADLLDAGLEDLILNLGENPLPEKLEQLGALMSVDDWPAWDRYIARPHEETTLLALIAFLGRARVPNALSRIIPFLRHNSPRVRELAIENLEARHSADLIPELAARLADPLPEVRAGIERIILSYEIDVLLPEMKNWVESADVNKRDWATRILKGIRQNESATLLKVLLYDEEAVVRRNAIRGLAFQSLPGNARLLNEYLEVCTDAEEEQLITRAVDFIENRRTDSPFRE